MSHVAIQESKVGEPVFACLAALKWAGERLGMELVEKSEYRWWGHHVGDFPLPPGMSKSELGHNAKYVLRFSEPLRSELAKKFGEPYEIGLVEDPNNPGCFLPIYDFYGGGHGLSSVVGAPVYKDGRLIGLCPQLMREYHMCCDALAAREAGDEIEFLNAQEAHLRYPDLFPEATNTTTIYGVVKTEQRLGV